MCQVIDLISLKPFDIETISNSVKKTKHVIVVEECMKTGGIGASLSALINESLFDYLDHQVCSHSFVCSVQEQAYHPTFVRLFSEAVPLSNVGSQFSQSTGK